MLWTANFPRKHCRTGVKNQTGIEQEIETLSSRLVIHMSVSLSYSLHPPKQMLKMCNRLTANKNKPRFSAYLVFTVGKLFWSVQELFNCHTIKNPSVLCLLTTAFCGSAHSAKNIDSNGTQDQFYPGCCGLMNSIFSRKVNLADATWKYKTVVQNCSCYAMWFFAA